MNLTPEEKQALAKKVKALGTDRAEALRYQDRLRSDFAFFVKEAWRIVEPHTDLVWGWYLDVLCEHLERVARGEEPKLLINIPPRHSKSLTVSVMFNAWVWLTQPHKKFIFVSFDQALLDGFSEQVQTIIDSAWFQEAIPTRFGPKKNEKWALGENRRALRYFMTTERGERQSTTVKGGITGKGADILVIDDPMKAADVRYPGALETVNHWYYNSAKSRSNNVMKSSVVCMMQRLAETDLAGTFIERDEEQKDNPARRPWTKLIFPIEFSPELKERFQVTSDIRTQPGELLLPERFPRWWVDEQKTDMSVYDWSAQYQQDPAPEGNGILNTRRIVFWYPAGMERDPKPWLEPGTDQPNEQIPLPKDGFVYYAMSADLTFKDTLNSDSVAIQAWARHKEAKFYLLDQIHGRMSFGATCEAITAFCAKHRKMTAKWVEDKANGPAVIDALSKRIPGMIAVNPSGGKVARANAVSPLFEAGNVVMPHPHVFPWMQNLLKEFRTFPKGKNDDTVDACTQALNQLHQKSLWHIGALAKSHRLR